MAYRRRHHCVTGTRNVYVFNQSSLLSDVPLSTNAAQPDCNIIIDFTNLLTRGE